MSGVPTQPGVKLNYYNRRGIRVSFEQAAELLRPDHFEEDRLVRQENVGRYHISTVLLVIDHNFLGGKPLIFETMVFEEGEEVWTDRYSTEEEAIKGHEAAVKFAHRQMKGFFRRFWKGG